jgi:HAE1 family hydrophobic/amphiphilic exporter-1
MPGITGQLFRQFALVIASTAIISALNALTLKPTQCALWLRPHVKKEPNLFYRGFNRAYAVVEHVYVLLIQWMVQRTTLMVLVFIAVIALAGWRFTQQPTGFLPTEDQGYCMVLARLPEGAAQPRVKRTSDAIDAILKRAQGIDAWVTVGGYSILDATNVSNIMTTFVIYQDWSKRGAKLSQNHIISALQQQFFAIQEAQIVVLVPPPIAGLGQAGGFQMMVEDRGSLGLAELQKAAMEIIRAASGQSGLGGMATTFSARSPQLYLDIDRTKAESLNIPLNNVFDTLQAYLGSTYVNLFNKFNQVFQVYVQADAAYRLQPEDIKSLYVRNLKGEMAPLGTLLKVNRTLGAELVTRYNLYPAASIFGGAAPGVSSGEPGHARSLPYGGLRPERPSAQPK